MSEEPQVLYAAKDRVATITLNRPDKLNAYTAVMSGELREAFAKAEADESVRAIVLTGAGRGFCAGADMARLSSAAAGKTNLKNEGDWPTEGLAANFAQRCSYILGVKKPIIAGINGAVAGIGLVLTLYCDIRYMAAGAKLTTSFARRGLIAEHGISWMLPRLIGPMNAMDLLLSARTVQAEEAASLGLVRVLPAEGFAEAVQARAAEIANLIVAALYPHHQKAGVRGAVPVACGGHRCRQSRAGDLPRHRGLPRGRRALRGEARADVHGAVRLERNQAQWLAFSYCLSLENPMKTLADAFEHTLQDVYYAENAITKALPKVIEAVSNADLKTALKDHLTETKGQIKTLEAVFKSIGKKASGEKCDAIEGLIKETEGIIEESKGAVAKNAALIGACQAVEHYEIARYGTLREWAKALGEDEAHELLSGILDQEKAANSKLTHIAISEINKPAK